MKRNLFILSLSIFILLFLSGICYAQSREIGIKISVLPFQNTSDVPAYDYLSQSMQKSIYASISQQKGIKVISNDISTNAAKEVGLTNETLTKVSTTLRFALKADINVIISGKYDIDYELNKIYVKTNVYSIAQKGIIISEEYESSLGGEEYSLIDNLSLETAEEVKERKEEIEIALEDIRRNITPPEYVKEPHIKEITLDGVEINWETTKETVSTLYIGTKPDFEITEDTPSFQDQSDNAINHVVIVSYSVLSPKGEKEYYFKSIDKDFFDNVKKGEEKKIAKEKISTEIKKIYNDQVDELYNQMEENIENKDFNKALEIYQKITNYNETFEQLIVVREDKNETETKKKQLKYATEVMDIITEAVNLSKEQEFLSAQKIYENAKQIIIENQIEHLISLELISYEINRMKSAIEVMSIIQEADALAEKEKYKKADEKYEESINKIKENDIQDLFSIEEIADKIKGEYELEIENNTNLNQSNSDANSESNSDSDSDDDNEILLPSYAPSKFFIKASVGGFFNALDLSEDIPVFLSWTASFNMRFNRVLSWGIGVNTLAADLFLNISPINKKKIEWFIKLNAIHTIIPGAMALGGGFGTGLVFRLNHFIGISMDLNSWAMYFYPNQTSDGTSLTKQLSVLAFANVGITLNF